MSTSKRASAAASDPHDQEPASSRQDWDGLAAAGIVVEPLAASAWSAGFGMVTDRFGVTRSSSVVAG